MHERRDSASREAVSNFALLVGGIAVSLLLGEALVRITDSAPGVEMIHRGRFRLSSNPLIGYEPVPSVNYGGEDLAFYDYHGASNSLGYRDREHALERSPGAYRIVVLGDSVGAGVMVVEGEEIFPPILEKMLQEDGIPAEVINLSVSGYNTQQEVETLKDRGLAYRPDLVLLAYCLNDRRYDGGGIMEALLKQELQAEGIPRARVTRPILIHSALYRFLRFMSLPKAGLDDDSYREIQVGRVSEDTSKEYLQELGRLAGQHGFRAVVAIFPTLDRLGAYPYGYEHERVARIVEQAGMHSLDLLEIFQGCAAEADKPIARDHIHPGPEGHRCAARAMADFIELRILGRLS